MDEALKHYSYEKLMDEVVKKALDLAIPSENSEEHPAKKQFGGKRH